MQNKELIVIVGPTGIGKTALSIYLAKQLNCEIISADSRQFYQEMSIGTAKPSKEEQKKVIHHFIDCMDIHEEYSAGKFELDTLSLLKELYKKMDQVIMVGGSGMYIDAVCKGIDAIPSARSASIKWCFRFVSIEYDSPSIDTTSFLAC